MGAVSAGGHRTSTIPRPEPAPRAAGSRRRSGGADSAAPQRPRHDLTAPIPRDKQLARARSSKLIVALLGLVVVVALASALFVLPVRDWLRQHDDIAQRQEELSALERANDELRSEVERLQTPEGIEQAAREAIGYIEPGDRRMSVLPLPDAPTSLPSGWPYDHVSQIIAIRTAQAAAAAATSASSP